MARAVAVPRGLRLCNAEWGSSLSMKSNVESQPGLSRWIPRLTCLSMAPSLHNRLRSRQLGRPKKIGHPEIPHPETSPDSEAQLFRYHPLQKGKTRLLRILPKSEEGHPSFRVEHFPRDEAPWYVAISYCWQSAGRSATYRILLDDRSFMVHQNLNACLHAACRNYGWKYLWVDAICIDQRKIQERNDQVATMDATYANAGIVVAWLGPERDYREHDTRDNGRCHLRNRFRWGVEDNRGLPYRPEPHSLATELIGDEDGSYRSCCWPVQFECFTQIPV